MSAAFCKSIKNNNKAKNKGLCVQSKWTYVPEAVSIQPVKLSVSVSRLFGFSLRLRHLKGAVQQNKNMCMWKQINKNIQPITNQRMK